MYLTFIKITRNIFNFCKNMLNFYKNNKEIKLYKFNKKQRNMLFLKLFSGV